jgi:adenosylcobinamide-GDP ribazoletransferase
MPKTEQKPVLLLDVAVAFALLTRLPQPSLPDAAFSNQARAGWAFPLVGALVAVLAGGLGLGALTLGLPVAAAAGLVLATQIILTGAMHEDGLADTADGLWGGWTRERRLEIMKDSAIGTYGVLALTLSLGLRLAALSALLVSGIGPVIVAATVSRALMPAVMTALPHARDRGLSHDVGSPGWPVSGIAALLGIALALSVCGAAALIPIGLAIVAVVAIAAIARAKIGGQTGDILGAGQQLAEIAILLGFAATLPV